MAKRGADGVPKPVQSGLTLPFVEDCGPRDLQQLWFWPAMALDKLASWNLLEVLEEKLVVGINMSTSYSGVGSAETALDFLVTACVRRGMGLGLVEVTTATDVSQACRSILLSHPYGISRTACDLVPDVIYLGTSCFHALRTQGFSEQCRFWNARVCPPASLRYLRGLAGNLSNRHHQRGLRHDVSIQAESGGAGGIWDCSSQCSSETWAGVHSESLAHHESVDADGHLLLLPA